MDPEIEQAIKPNIGEMKKMTDTEVVHDEFTGEPLGEASVRKAKNEELKFFRTKGVWRITPRARAQNQHVVGSRRVTCNKGDVENPRSDAA